MIPVEDFLQIKPEHINGDEKALMFARISHELSEREALEQARQGLLKKKQSLIADNKKRKDDLASLDKDLETFIDVSRLFELLLWGVLTISRLRNLFRRFLKNNIDKNYTKF